MSIDVWVGAVTTLAGVALGGGISFSLNRQQMKDARKQRAEEAALTNYQRSVDRRFDAFASFHTCARTYRNAINPYRKHSGPALDHSEIDSIARSADAAASLVFLVVESGSTYSACRSVVLAIGNTQNTLHNGSSPLPDSKWRELNDALTVSLRHFQISAREELQVHGVDRSRMLSRETADDIIPILTDDEQNHGLVSAPMPSRGKAQNK